MYDVVVIGAGVTGCAVARELSAYQLKTMVLEREEDVCCGTSKANSAIVHAGFDAAPGSWKARMNVEGNRKIRQLSKELDFPYKQNGSLVLCFEEQDLPNLYELKERGEKKRCRRTGNYYRTTDLGNGAKPFKRGKSYVVCSHRRDCLSF